MGKQRNPEKTKKLMIAVRLIKREAKAGFPNCTLKQAEEIDEVISTAGARIRMRIRIAGNQGTKSDYNKDKLQEDEE